VRFSDIAGGNFLSRGVSQMDWASGGADDREHDDDFEEGEPEDFL
jgi:hypothetical protein